MNPTQGDDALNWAGDDDPTLQVGDDNRAATDPVELAEGWTVAEPSSRAHGAGDSAAVGDADATPNPTPADDSDEPVAQSSAALVGLGILGGIYLLYTIGWFIGVSRLNQPISDPVSEFMFSLGSWLAVAAPLVWFGVIFWLTTSRPRARLLWLLAGVVLLAPLSFIVGTGVSA